MIDEKQEELASLYALDLLEGEERTRFETALARDAALQTRVTELRESSAALAHGATVPPPTALKDRVLRSIAAGDAGRPAPNAKLAIFRAFAPWVMAACFALVGLRLAQRLATMRGELALARTEAEIAGVGLQSARNLREAEQIVAQKQIFDLTARVNDGEFANLKIATLASKLNNAPEALAVAVWNLRKQEGVFTAEKMPAPEVDQNYELWVIEGKPGAKPVSAGMFAPGADGTASVRFKATAPVEAVARFAVSRERKDGARSHAAPTEVVMTSR